MRPLLSFALTILAACGSKTPPPAEAVPTPQAKESAPAEITLTPEMAAKAGIALANPERRALPATLRVNGPLAVNAEATNTAGSVVEGRVVEVLANPGDRVQKDQVIARMHSHEIHESRAAYEKSKVELARVEAQQALAQRNRDRLKRLLDLKAAAAADLDLAGGALRDAAAAVRVAQFDLRRNRQHLEEHLGISAESPPGHKPGETDHDDDLIPVKSPIAGAVIARQATAGSVARPGDPLFVISNLSTVWMLAAVPEANMAALRPGAAVNVYVNAFPDRPFPGRLTRIGDQLNPEMRTVEARITLANPRGELKPEMYAAAEFPLPGARETVLVPAAAVQEINGLRVVFEQAAPGRFIPRTVDTGRTAAGLVEILGGLDGSKPVVTSGAYALKSQIFKSTLSEED
jgi:membrane fusion protein, heavy metal efflux system